MDTVTFVIEAATEFYGVLKADKNARYRSWEHCYKCFHDARSNTDADYDYLSLQLAFYLASWGMYRGSSYLLQKDYKVHIPVVKEILEKEYDCLFGIKCLELRKKAIQERLRKLECFIESFYDGIRKTVRSTDRSPSATLITKILMGTLGCVPAYDRYFIEGVKELNISTGTYNMNSLLKLVDFYETNYEQLEKERKKLKVYDLPYPQMKLLDMGFWQVGDKKDKKEKVNSETHNTERR